MAKKQQVEVKTTKFTRTYVDEDGFKAIWTYDHKISKAGPIKVEIVSHTTGVPFREKKKKQKVVSKRKKKVASLK